MTRFASPALVLGSEPQGETDRRYELLTPGQGRLWVLAKGAARSIKRFSGGFDQAQLIEAGFLTGGRTERVLIEHGTVLETFPALRNDPRRLGRAGVLIEVARLTVPLHQPAAGAFNLLVRGLKRLHDEPDSDRWAVVYALRLLGEAGLTPELACCTACARPAGRSRQRFSPAAGGLVCSSCRDDDDGCLPVSSDVLKTLSAVMSASEDRLPRFQFSPRTLKSSRELLRHFAAHHLTRPLRSLEFLARFDAAD